MQSIDKQNVVAAALCALSTCATADAGLYAFLAVMPTAGNFGAVQDNIQQAYSGNAEANVDAVGGMG
jgi:hypothetical protein